MKRIKVGMIGCGWFANVHLENLKINNCVEIVAIVGTNSEKLNDIGEKYPEAHLYAQHQDMFDQESELDAIYICIPPSTHSDVEILAAQRGIHLYVEKPIELSMEKALEISKAIVQNNIITSVGYQERYNPEIDRIKDYIKDRSIGLVNGRWVGGMPQVHWWRKHETSGGQIVEQSTHIVDMLRYLFGEITSVYCIGVKGLINNVENYNIEDGSSTVMMFASGVVGTVSTACYQEEIKDYEGVGFQILAKDSVIDYIWDKEVTYKTIDSVTSKEFDRGCHQKASEAFIEAIRTNNPSLIKSDYADALKTLQVTLAANQSIMTGEPVMINSRIKQ